MTEKEIIKRIKYKKGIIKAENYGEIVISDPNVVMVIKRYEEPLKDDLTEEDDFIKCEIRIRDLKLLSKLKRNLNEKVFEIELDNKDKLLSCLLLGSTIKGLIIPNEEVIKKDNIKKSTNVKESEKIIDKIEEKLEIIDERIEKELEKKVKTTGKPNSNENKNIKKDIKKNKKPQNKSKVETDFKIVE